MQLCAYDVSNRGAQSSSLIRSAPCIRTGRGHELCFIRMRRVRIVFQSYLVLRDFDSLLLPSFFLDSIWLHFERSDELLRLMVDFFV